MAASPDKSDDVLTQVLQTTLAEISSHHHGTSKASDGDEPSTPDCCVICLEGISEPCCALPCAHANFDFLCLLSWLEQRPSCPLCKAPVQQVRYRDANAAERLFPVSNTTDTPAPTQTREQPIPRPRRRRRTPSPDGLTRPADAIAFRRDIYRHNLYSLRTPPSLPPSSPITIAKPPPLRHRHKPTLTLPPPPHPLRLHPHATPGLARAPVDPSRATSLFLPLRNHHHHHNPHPHHGPHHRRPPARQRRVPPRVHRRHPQDSRRPGQRGRGGGDAGGFSGAGARGAVLARAEELVEESGGDAGGLGSGGEVSGARREEEAGKGGRRGGGGGGGGGGVGG